MEVLMDNKKIMIKNIFIFILIEIGIIAIISLYWWLSDDHTALNYSNISFIGGAIVMVVGLLIMRGTIGATGSFSYQYARTTSPDPIHERTTRDWKERFSNQFRILLFILYGLPPILLGILAYKIWG